MNRRVRIRSAILIFGLVISLLTIGMASAHHLGLHEPLWTIRGTVTTLDGAPLAGARLHSIDWPDSTYTDSEGKYVLQVTNDHPASDVRLQIDHHGWLSQTKRVSYLDAQEPVDFALELYVGSFSTPIILESVPVTIDLSAYLADSVSSITHDEVCVRAEDHRTGQIINLQRTQSGWSGSLAVPADLREGWFFVGVLGVRCFTGVPLSKVYTQGKPPGHESGYGWRYYAHDHSAPTGTILSPQEGRLYVAGLEDEGTSGRATVVGPVHVEATVEDSAGLNWVDAKAIDSTGKRVGFGVGDCYQSYRWYIEGEMPSSATVSCDLALPPGKYILRLEADSLGGTLVKDLPIVVLLETPN